MSLAATLERRPMLPRVIIILAALLACAPLLRYGAIAGNDLWLHLIWVKHFTAQLAQGDLYPRWLMDMHLGAGSPTFYFYPPLTYYIAALPGLLLPPIGLMAQHAIAETTLLALSGLAFYHYARPRFGALPAVSAAIVYMVLPYHYEIDLWTRQDLSEFANYIWLPLVLHSTERVFEDKEALTSLAIAYAGMMVTHLPTALLFSLCLGAYILVLLLPQPSWRRLARFCAAIALGMLLAAIYWVPAVFCQKYIHAEEWWPPRYDFHLFFFPPSHPISPLVDAAFITRLFNVICLTAGILVLCVLGALRWRGDGPMKRLWACLALAIVAGFFMTSWSGVLWETLPLLRKVQFPWRIAIALDLATAIAVAFLANNLARHRDKLTTMAGMLAMVVLLYGARTSQAHFPPVPDNDAGKLSMFFLAHSVGVGKDTGAHRPQWWNPAHEEENDRYIAALGKVGPVGAERSLRVSDWNPREIAIDVDLQQDVQLTLRQFYFPNWRARIGDSNTPLKITPAINTGLIQIDAPAGKYRLQLYKVLLREEKIGITLSCLALSSLLGRTIWLRRRNRQGK